MSEIDVWPALGVEVAGDRKCTWVARAAPVDGLVVVELLDPVPGTAAAVGVLCGWREAWQVAGVGVDPRSPSATLVQPIQDAGLPLVSADAHGLAVAHGQFQDLLDVGGLRARGNEALKTAVRQAAERKLAGAHAVDRYGGVDLAPLVAAELAVWVLLSFKPRQVLLVTSSGKDR